MKIQLLGLQNYLSHYKNIFKGSVFKDIKKNLFETQMSSGSASQTHQEFQAASLVLGCRDCEGNSQENHPTPSSPDGDIQLPETACSKVHYQQLPLSQPWAEGTHWIFSQLQEEMGKMHLPRWQFVQDEASLHCIPFSLDQTQPLLQHSSMCLNNRAPSWLHQPYLLRDERARTASVPDSLTSCGTLCTDVILQPHGAMIKLCSGWPLNIS